MTDLFELFPDLPRAVRKPLTPRVSDVRLRVLDVRRRAKLNALKQKEAARLAVARRGRRR